MRDVTPRRANPSDCPPSMRAGTTDADEDAADVDTPEGDGDDEGEEEEEEEEEDEEKEEAAVDWVRDLVDGRDALVLACRAAWYAN